MSGLNADGNPDISAGGLTNNRFYSHTWLGDGDGTFGGRDTQKSNPLVEMVGLSRIRDKRQ